MLYFIEYKDDAITAVISSNAPQENHDGYAYEEVSADRYAEVDAQLKAQQEERVAG